VSMKQHPEDIVEDVLSFMGEDAIADGMPALGDSPDVLFTEI